MTVKQLKKDIFERISNENLRFGEFIYTIKKKQESEIFQYIKKISEKYGAETETRVSLLWLCGIDEEHLWVSVRRKGA